ncbi:MAG: histidine phosphatase family protein [Cyanobacteriota bacterium]|nr:histidine phosphatase family protein [Cyanobacteriota bacterium]
MFQTLWIARHGNRLDFVDPDWFAIAERPYDPPLSDDGVVQAQELGYRLQSENIKHIFASPFLRTVQTAYEVAKVLDKPIKLEAGLCEWLNPDWMPATPARLPQEVLAAEYPAIDLSYRSRVIPEYPESEDLLRQRMTKTAKLLTEEFSEEILFVTHGAFVVEGTAGLMGGRPLVNPQLCCLVKLIRHPGEWKMELNGDTSHLTQKQEAIRLN